jgi:uncharacterized protein (TIGR01777 family)
MRALITGASGLLGSALCEELTRAGWEVVALSRRPRDPSPDVAEWIVGDPGTAGSWLAEVGSVQAVVHLAGESIASGRWTRTRKERLVSSRVESTRLIAEAIRNCETPPGDFLCASAVGYYGPRGDEELREDAEPGSDFLACLCRDWESAAMGAAREGLAIQCLRFGVILSPRGGALAKMLPPFKMGVGGPLGPSGRWFPWIHQADAVGLIKHRLEHRSVESRSANGAINVVAPGAITMGDFAKALGRALNRPAVLPVPLGVLRLVLGEMAEMLSPGQRVMAERAVESGYDFRYPDLESALRAALDTPR